MRHFPPGTSKWNKIEHRLFSFITQNWRGKPLVSHQTIVNLIASTRTNKGLTVKAEIDDNTYPTQIKVTDAELSQVKLKRESFHGEWNYTTRPKWKVVKVISEQALTANYMPPKLVCGIKAANRILASA